MYVPGFYWNLFRREQFTAIELLDDSIRMPVAEACIKIWIYLGFIAGLTRTSRPRFDISTDMRKVLVPADAEIDSVIFRLRATDEEPDFPLIFNITSTVIPVVRIENLPCTLYNKVCQANVILTRRLSPGKFYDFLVIVKDSKGENNSMQATISVTNGTTPRNKIFLHKPSLIMVPEDTKAGAELDYLIVQSNPWSGKPVYIELWQPKDLFKIVQRQTARQTQGLITLIGQLDFETQTMHTLTMYATDPYTEPVYDTRNIVGVQVVVVVQDIQDVPPIFTIAPPLTKINNTIQPGDVILRVHAEDGDKGVPREVTYGLVSEGNPFTPFFHINESTGEIYLARPLDELTQIIHVGAPVILSVVAEEVRHSWNEPPAQATVVELGILLGEPENSPPYFESDNYVAWMDENAEPGTILQFSDSYSTKVKDEDIGKAGLFALKLEYNNGTFEINPTVAERTTNFVITVRDNTLLDYELYKSLSYQIVAQEVGPTTNLSAFVPATVFLKDVNDNAPKFDESVYKVTLSENSTAGTRVLQVHATDKDTDIFGSIKYTRITGPASEAFVINPDSGLITVSMKSNDLLDRESTEKLELFVEARDENGKGLKSEVPLIIHLLDVNDNAPIFEKQLYKFILNSDMTNFTSSAFIKATDADAEPPNNEVRYEIIHGNYENKFYLDEITGELFLREEIHKPRRVRQNEKQNLAFKLKKEFSSLGAKFSNRARHFITVESTMKSLKENQTEHRVDSVLSIRTKRAEENILFTLTVRVYDLGVPLLSSTVPVHILQGAATGARIVTFVMPGEHPDPNKTAETLATITGGRVTIQEIRPYVSTTSNQFGSSLPNYDGGKKSIIVARVEQNGSETLVDIEKIRESLAANGVGVISGMDGMQPTSDGGESSSHSTEMTKTNTTNISSTQNEEVTVYKAENKILMWLLIILGILLLLAIATIILCCICPGCPFYMEPRKRRIHSSETLIVRSNGRPRRHVQRRHFKVMNGFWPEMKQAWSADPSRRNWQFNRRNMSMNHSLGSLPGDVTRVSESKVEAAPPPKNAEPSHLQVESVHVHKKEHEIQQEETEEEEEENAKRRRAENKIFIKDSDNQVGNRMYDMTDADSIRRHELDRGSDIYRRPYHKLDQQQVEDYEEAEKCIREQHYYREGNAEVLRLVSRGHNDEVSSLQRSNVLMSDQQTRNYRMNNGKDILLQRFIEDQKMQKSQQEALFSTHQPEIILVPGSLDHRHFENLRADIQHIILEHGDYNKLRKHDRQDNQFHDPNVNTIGITRLADKSPNGSKEKMINLQSYATHDAELVRQNNLLTRLLLERENRGTGGMATDVANYLETQSLPGQVAIVTQTGRTAATQTDRRVRSRSDNEESEDDSRLKKKFKFKKRYNDDEPTRIKSIWMRSPISEKSRYIGMKMAVRKKMAEMREGRKVSLSPEVLQEISESLNGNDNISSNIEEEDENILSNYCFDSERDVKNSSNKDPVDVSTSSQEDNEHRMASMKHMERKEVDKSKKANKIEPSFRILESKSSTTKERTHRIVDKKQKSNVEVIVEKGTSKKIKEMKKSSNYRRKISKGIRDSRVKDLKTTVDTTLTKILGTNRKTKVTAKAQVKNKQLKHQVAMKIDSESSGFDDAGEKTYFDVPKQMDSLDKWKSSIRSPKPKKDVSSSESSKQESKMNSSGSGSQSSKAKKYVSCKEETVVSSKSDQIANKTENLTNDKDKFILNEDREKKINLVSLRKKTGTKSLDYEKVKKNEEKVVTKSFDSRVENVDKIDSMQQITNQIENIICVIHDTKATMRILPVDEREIIDIPKQIDKMIKEDEYSNESEKDPESYEQVKYIRLNDEDTIDLTDITDNKDYNVEKIEKNEILQKNEEPSQAKSRPMKPTFKKQEKVIENLLLKKLKPDGKKPAQLVKQFTDDFSDSLIDTEKYVIKDNEREEKFEASESIILEKNVDESAYVEHQDEFVVETDKKINVAIPSDTLVITSQKKEKLTAEEKIKSTLPEKILEDKKSGNDEILKSEADEQKQKQLECLDKNDNDSVLSPRRLLTIDYDSDSSGQSDMSSKTMLNTHFYNTLKEKKKEEEKSIQLSNMMQTATKVSEAVEAITENKQLGLEDEQTIDKTSIEDTSKQSYELDKSEVLEKEKIQSVSPGVEESVQILGNYENTHISKYGKSSIDVIQHVVMKRHSVKGVYPKSDTKSINLTTSLNVPKSPIAKKKKTDTQNKSTKHEDKKSSKLLDIQESLILSETKSATIKGISPKSNSQSINLTSLDVSKSPIVKKKKTDIRNKSTKHEEKESTKSLDTQESLILSETKSTTIKGISPKSNSQSINLTSLDVSKSPIAKKKKTDIQNKSTKHEEKDSTKLSDIQECLILSETKSTTSEQNKEEDNNVKQDSRNIKIEKRKKTSISTAIDKGSNQLRGTVECGKEARSRYMIWYKQKRAEMERKRREKKEAEEEEQRPRWMRRSKTSAATARGNFKGNVGCGNSCSNRRKVKPLVNVESEQLKAIVRQGRKMRKGHVEDPSVQIFVPERPPPRHHLLQHSEYKYERVPPPFYLHPPPVPHPSPEPCPESSMQDHGPEDDIDSGIAVSMQGGCTKLRHQQLLEKKSVFDIAYSEAAPTKLRSDSSTPPS